MFMSMQKPIITFKEIDYLQIYYCRLFDTRKEMWSELRTFIFYG